MKIGYIPLFFMIAAVIFAQEEDSVSVYQLDQISVTATRSQISIFDAPNQVISVNTDDVINRSDRLVPDLFQSSASVYMQKTNFGGGAPIIRGFLGNQVLILVDGIRLNNSTFRYGPNQYLNTIDPSIIQNIEVLHGPSSVLYGSDALGGVINIITMKPSQATSEISSTTRTSTADESIYQNLNYHGSTGRFSYSLGGTYRNFNNLNAGGDVGAQQHTNFSGYDANASLNYQLNDDEKLFLSYQFTKQDDVPRTDRLTSGTDLKYFFSPQVRQLAYVNYKGQNITPFLSSISATASFNFQEEGREIISSSTPNLESNDLDKVKTIGAQVIASSVFDINKLIYGIEFYRDKVNSYRELKNLTSGEVKEEKGRFTDNSNYQTIGIFLQDRISLGNFVLSAGARYTNFQFDGNVGDPFGEISSSKGDLTFSGSITYSIIPQNLNFILSYSQGFRAPNVDDITSFGKSGSGDAARYDTPNPNLAAEKSNNYEVGFKLRFSNFEASSFIYYSKVTDLLEPKPTIYNGVDSLFGFPTYSRANVGEAEIFGWDTYLQWNPLPEWLFSFNASYSQGNNLTDGEPLSRIPPLNGYAGITWFQDFFTVKYHVYWALDQDRLSARDKRDYRIGTGGTPGYVIQNISAGLNFSKHVDLFFTFENITNKLYKTHGSGLYSPGRSLNVSLLLRY